MSLGDTNASGAEGQLVVRGGRGGNLQGVFTVCVMATQKGVCDATVAKASCAIGRVLDALALASPECVKSVRPR